MASTTEDDTPHDGAPTSWSSEIDQLASGASGLQKRQRLILVSAANSDQNAFIGGNYLAVSDHPDNELESPAQAWNAISVGAYTQKVTMPPGEPGACAALAHLELAILLADQARPDGESEEHPRSPKS
ncbi:S8 family serine peptidase [Mesorhizobium sp. CCNWLW179-1]|uniref:S8 family serine peptidase n=1 Tax=Mesorhizobium sp. CCNWLW179-1 TaxID=3136721 RepID=UPI003212E3DD